MMDLNNKKREKNFPNEFFIEDARETHPPGELFIAREESEEYLEDGMEEEIQNWGVYLQGKEKTLLGLFWDQELANIFLNAIKNSNALDKMKEIA